MNTPEDTESLTSTALSELASPSRNVTAFWHTCRLNRQLRFSDRTVDELVFACHRLATRYLILKQNFDALGAWCRFAHRQLRRGTEETPGLIFPPSWPRPSALLVRDAETGELEALAAEHLPLKLAHDLAQLQILGSQHVQLRRKAQELQELGADLPESTPYPGNRANFVPDLRLASNAFREKALESLPAHTQQGFSVVDGLLQKQVLEELRSWFVQATVWHLGCLLVTFEGFNMLGLYSLHGSNRSFSLLLGG